MDIDALSIIGWIVVLVINVIGWWLSANRNSKAVAEAARIAKETAATELNNMKVILGNLPCVTDPNYQKREGKMEEQVNNLKESMDRLEGKLDKFLVNKFLGKRGG